MPFTAIPPFHSIPRSSPRSEGLRMEDDSSSSAQAIITQNTCHIFSMCILYYDHLIQLDTEVQYMWRRRKSASSAMFLTLRYAAPMSNIPTVVFSFVPVSAKGCSLLNLSHEILIICTQVLVSVIMIQRMYALYGRSKKILWGLSGTAIAFTGVIIWLTQHQDSFPLFVLPGCHIDLPRNTSLRLAGGWGALFLFDTIVALLTISNAYSTRRRLGAQAQTDMPIHTLIVRDGAMYFAAIAVSNLANILTFIFNGPWIPGSLTIFTSCISITMVCRLMLNIHEKADVDATDFNLSGLLEGTSIPDLDFDSPDAAVV